jgi:hypothetical protein
MTSSLLKPLIVRMNSLSLPKATQDRTAALLTLRRYGLGTFSGSGLFPRFVLPVP